MCWHSNQRSICYCIANISNEIRSRFEQEIDYFEIHAYSYIERLSSNWDKRDNIVGRFFFRHYFTRTRLLSILHGFFLSTLLCKHSSSRAFICSPTWNVDNFADDKKNVFHQTNYMNINRREQRETRQFSSDVLFFYTLSSQRPRTLNE